MAMVVISCFIIWFYLTGQIPTRTWLPRSYRLPSASLAGIRISMSHLLLRKWRGEVLEKHSVPNQIKKATGISNRLLTVVTICLLYRDTDFFSLT